MDEALVFSVAGLVAPHPLAAAAGRDVMIEGGTIVEAAIAAAMVSAVVVSHRNGLGGDALWLIRAPGPRGRVRVLDARGRTGALATASRFRDLDRRVVPDRGPDAVLAVPGAIAGCAEAHALAAASGGRLHLSRLLAPAIAAARDGFAPLPRDIAARAEAGPALRTVPGFAATFLDDGEPPPPGALQRFPLLAGTLDHLARSGLDDLYRGDVGREIAADLAALGCPLTRDDLRRSEARWREPASLDLGRDALDIAPHGAAVAAAVALGLYAGLGPSPPDGFDRWHGIIEGAKHAAGVIDEAPLDRDGIPSLLDREALKRAADRIDRKHARRDAPPIQPFPEDGIFVGAIDRDGAAVALVQTLGTAFGSGVVSGRTGILLGNRAAALALDADTGPLLAPGRRVPLLSTPALISGRDGRVASLGATGPHGALLMMQLAERLLRGTAPAEAVAAPRFALGAAPGGSAGAVLVEVEDREPPPGSRLRAAGHLLVQGAADLRTAGAACRLPSARIAASSDDGDAAVAGF